MNIGTMTPPPQHVIAISGKAVTLPVLQYAHEIDTAWLNRYADKALDTYNRACMLSTAFFSRIYAGQARGKSKAAASCTS